MTKQIRRVAVLGGGMASLTAAYELTRPEFDGAFDVTVYQQGWRLGGKGASGRNPHRANRIEEHGLHVWMGFYENAFRLIRDCYERLHREPGTPLATWQDAFKPHSYIVFDDVDPSTGTARRWPLCFPEDGPADRPPVTALPFSTPPEYVPRILQLIVMLLRNAAPTQHLVPTTEHSVSVVGGSKRWWCVRVAGAPAARGVDRAPCRPARIGAAPRAPPTRPRGRGSSTTSISASRMSSATWPGRC